MIASVAKRLGGSAPSLKFKPKPELKNVVRLFSEAQTIQPTARPSVWNVFGEKQIRLGFVLSTTPSADHLSGYQGPTATLAGFDADGKCVGLVVDQSYENDPYARYLDDEYSFQGIYQGKTLEELAKFLPEENGIEGVSGATMTSMSVAEALPLAAATAIRPVSVSSNSVVTRTWFSYWADGVTLLLTLFGLLFSFTKLSKHAVVRISFQLAVILFLGFINGHMLSQALFVGWSANAIPWSVAPGIVGLSIAAILIPVVSKHQPYCQHICPLGALQQLVGNKVGWKVRLSSRLRRCLELIPYLLLLLVVIVAMTRSSFNLASIEAFDGFAFRVAGFASIAILVSGLLFSVVSPMAYCRFGCPTGAVISFLKFRADSHRLGVRDLAAVSLLAVAAVLLFW